MANIGPFVVRKLECITPDFEFTDGENTLFLYRPGYVPGIKEKGIYYVLTIANIYYAWVKVTV